MTLKETKDKVSQSLGYEDWKELVKDQSTFGDAWFDLIVTNVAELHAIEKVKDALRTAARNSGVIFHDGTSKQETHHSQVMCGNNIIKPNRGGIIALETELIENIKKEK